jgi:hypothetical protein
LAGSQRPSVVTTFYGPALTRTLRAAAVPIPDIRNQTRVRVPAKEKRGQLPKFSIAIGIWLTAILIGATQFDTVLSLFRGASESRIEQDVEGILSKAAASLRTYEINTGVLPPVLPNPAIRGLVRYERHSDFSFRLTATIGDVTMVMDSKSTRPHRELEPD